jgi:MoaA/NifB/PqqE/SkfB family radical SAM enzyme
VKLLDRRRSSFRYLRLRARLGRARPTFSEPPPRPVGIKLELTYACNLRCGFCYTDSPRRTLERAVDLSDDAWRAIVEEAIELGIVEAVVTGGEPLLRRELALEVIERLTSEGIGVAFNTNGWFLDDEVVARLRGLPGLTVHVSLDGAAPHLHDASRGVPGSWRRAVEGIDRLLTAGVGVCVVHVVTPENEHRFAEMLEHMWVLGVPWIRPTPVVISGAAARGGEWSVDEAALRRVIEDFERRRGTAMRIDLRGGDAGSLASEGAIPPASLLVRPAGAVRTDSLRPFSYGNAARDGVAACWDRIRQRWRDPAVRRWAGAIRRGEDLGRLDLVPYLDEDLEIAEAGSMGAGARDAASRAAKLPAPVPLPEVDPEEELQTSAKLIRDLALRRRYRTAPVRAGGDPEEPVVRTREGRFLRLNRTAAIVMASLDGGTPQEAAARLEEVFGEVPGDGGLVAVGAARDLQAAGVLVPAGSDGPGPPADPGPSDLPGLEPTAT